MALSDALSHLDPQAGQTVRYLTVSDLRAALTSIWNQIVSGMPDTVFQVTNLPPGDSPMIETSTEENLTEVVIGIPQGSPGLSAYQVAQSLGFVGTEAEWLASLAGPITGTAAATQINFTASGTGAVTRTIQDRMRETVSVKDFGATGNGTTDDTAAIQAAVAAADATKTTLFVPGGIYRTSGITITDRDDFVMQFAADAWLKPTSGWALTVNSSERVQIHSPRVWFQGGTPAGGILLTSGATRCTITEPVIYLMANDAGTPAAIKVEGDSYWATIVRPQIRKFTGGIANNFTNGIEIAGQANAARILQGGINNCAVGVLLSHGNGVSVVGTAFEGIGTAFRVGDNSNNSGWLFAQCRLENCTTGVEILKTATNGVPGVVADNFYVGVPNVFVNPNGIATTRKEGNWLRLAAAGYGLGTSEAGLEITPWGQTTPAIRVNGRVHYNPGELPTFEVNQVGRVGLGTPASGIAVYMSATAGAGLKLEHSALGFFGVTPAAKPTVTGSRGGNAALASLLTALANLGLITDSTTA